MVMRLYVANCKQSRSNDRPEQKSGKLNSYKELSKLIKIKGQ